MLIEKRTFIECGERVHFQSGVDLHVGGLNEIGFAVGGERVLGTLEIVGNLEFWKKCASNEEKNDEKTETTKTENVKNLCASSETVKKKFYVELRHRSAWSALGFGA